MLGLARKAQLRSVAFMDSAEDIHLPSELANLRALHRQGDKDGPCPSQVFFVQPQLIQRRYARWRDAEPT
jgi:hypothetical protein